MPPALIMAPTIVGGSSPPIVGERLYYSPGQYAGAEHVSYFWQDERGSPLGMNVPHIDIEQGSVGHSIHVLEDATNAQGTIQTASNELGPVLAVAPAWITADDVSDYLDLPGEPDDRLLNATAAVRAAVERRRSDVDFLGPVPDDIRVGSIRWAGLIYQARGAPSGFTGYDDASTLYDALGSQRAEIMRLIGWRRPVAV